MPRTPRRQSRVRFNLPLNRENTVYSDTSSSRHIPNLSEEESDRTDEDFVANWLLTDGTPPARPYRMHVSELVDPDAPSRSVTSIPGPLTSQLIHAGMELLGQIPPDDVPLPPVHRHRADPQPRLSKLKKSKRMRAEFTYPDGTPISFHYSRAYFNDDEQEYVIPPDTPSSSSSSSSTPFDGDPRPELRIPVTKDWSSRKLSKQRDDQLLIYRVPLEHQVYFGMTVSEHGLCGVTLRKPEDEDDPIRVTRHGHPSWDLGFQNEAWYLIAKNPHTVESVYNRVSRIQPSLYVRMKRLFWKNFGYRRSPAMTGILS